MYTVAEILIILLKAKFHSVEFIKNDEDHRYGLCNEEKKVWDFMRKMASFKL